jgi:hypothetical protein
MSSDRERIEEQIRDVLAAEGEAISLSNALFGPNGLFGQLAANEQERRLVAKSALFQQAQKRLSELQRKEGEAFTEAVRQARDTLPAGDYWLKLERLSAQ